MAQPPINPKVLAALKAVAAAKRKPIVVTNPNDPRLKAYQDSASNYKERQEDLVRLNETKRLWDLKHKKYNLVQDAVPFKDFRGRDRIGYTFTTGDPKNPLPTNAATEGTNVLAPRYVQPQQPVVYQKPIPRTPVIVPAKIPIKLAPTNFVAPLPATPAPQPVAVAQPIQPAPPNKPDSLWAPGQRYSLKDEKVRRMLKAIQSLKRQ